MENPRRDLPKALFASIGLIVVAYLLPCLAALTVGRDGAAGWANWGDGSFAEVGKVLGGPWLQAAVTIGGMFSAVAMFSALLASNSRLPLVLSRDGYLPARLTHESKRFKAPIASIVGSSAIYAVFCLSSFGDLVVVDVFLTNVVILLEVAALVALRIREPGLTRPYRVPGGWAAIAAIVVSLTAVCAFAAWAQYQDSGTRSVVYGLATVAFSFVVYVPLERWRRARIRRGTLPDLGAHSPAYLAWLADATDRGPGVEEPPSRRPRSRRPGSPGRGQRETAPPGGKSGEGGAPENPLASASVPHLESPLLPASLRGVPPSGRKPDGIRNRARIPQRSRPEPPGSSGPSQPHHSRSRSPEAIPCVHPVRRSVRRTVRSRMIPSPANVPTSACPVRRSARCARTRRTSTSVTSPRTG